MSATTDPVMQRLWAAACTPAAAARVADVLARVSRRLEDGAEPMAWEPLPLSTFDDALPEEVRSCWVFVLRRGERTDAERHPNSHQRSFSLTGSGTFELYEAGRWVPHPLASDPAVAVAQRQVSIPPSTWHRLTVDERAWGMLSFHTVAAEDLIEEQPIGPDGLDGGATRQRRYQAGHDQD